MDNLPTVKVKSSRFPDQEFVIINKGEFNPETDELIELNPDVGEPEQQPPPKVPIAEVEVWKQENAERLANADITPEHSDQLPPGKTVEEYNEASKARRSSPDQLAAAQADAERAIAESDKAKEQDGHSTTGREPPSQCPPEEVKKAKTEAFKKEQQEKAEADAKTSETARDLADQAKTLAEEDIRTAEAAKQAGELKKAKDEKATGEKK